MDIDTSLDDYNVSCENIFEQDEPKSPSHTFQKKLDEIRDVIAKNHLDDALLLIDLALQEIENQYKNCYAFLELLDYKTTLISFKTLIETKKSNL